MSVSAWPSTLSFLQLKHDIVRKLSRPKPAAGTADVLNSAVARFPGDPDIVASANYIKYNRARQGKLQVRLPSNRC